MEIIGHRGASFDAPENTLASFRRGWEQHADAVELDIRQTKDGRIVVIHDQDTQRVTGVNRLVEEQTLEEIRQLDAGVWKDSRWVGEKVPLLSEALALVPAGKRLFIEVKCGIAVVPELVREIHAANQQPTQTVVIGFCSKTMAAVKSLLPAVEVYLVANISQRDASQAIPSPSIEDLLQRAIHSGIDGLNLSACKLIDKSFVAHVTRRGLKLAVWTVNDPTIAREMMDAGVQSLASDRPGFIRDQLALPFQ